MPLATTTTRRVVAERSKVPYALDDGSRLGAGGGGTVFRVHGNKAVKIMDAPEPTKLRALMYYHKAWEPLGIVCPEDLILDREGGIEIGYLMPLAPGQTVEDGPDGGVPAYKRILAAVAFARAVSAIHGLKSPRWLLRDCKDANVMIDYGPRIPVVSVIDVDSFCAFGIRDDDGSLVDLVSTYKTKGFNPVEHLDSPTLAPSQATDLFAVGVVLFQILHGKSPYDVVGSAVGDLDDAVTAKKFQKYILGGKPPRYAIADVPTKIDEMFRECFFLSPSNRPSAEQWVTNLQPWADEMTPKEKPDPKTDPLGAYLEEPDDGLPDPEWSIRGTLRWLFTPPAPFIRGSRRRFDRTWATWVGYYAVLLFVTLLALGVAFLFTM